MLGNLHAVKNCAEVTETDQTNFLVKTPTSEMVKVPPFLPGTLTLNYTETFFKADRP